MIIDIHVLVIDLNRQKEHKVREKGQEAAEREDEGMRKGGQEAGNRVAQGWKRRK